MMDIAIINADEFVGDQDEVFEEEIVTTNQLQITVISVEEMMTDSYPDVTNNTFGFNDLGTFKHNGGYRDFWTEKDWDFVYHLMMVKVARKFRAKRMIILDDYQEFRYMPKDWAENFCNELIKRGYKHMVDFKVYHDDTPRD